MIVSFEFVSLLSRAISTDGTDVHHSGSVLDESSSILGLKLIRCQCVLPLNGDVKVSDVSQDKVDELFKVLLTEVVLD